MNAKLIADTLPVPGIVATPSAALNAASAPFEKAP